MQGLSKSSLANLKERLLGRRMELNGNVAVAMAVCELTENTEKVSFNIEALLLNKRSRRVAHSFAGLEYRKGHHCRTGAVDQ